MKRDDDLIRELLLEMEAEDDYLFSMVEALDSQPDEQKRYGHALLLCDAGLVEQRENMTFRITAAGHDYLAAMRDPGIWATTKAKVAETGGNATLTMLQDLATALLRKKVSDLTGIDL